MKKNIFKVLFALVGLLFASSAFAIPKGPCPMEPVCCDEPAPGPFAFAYPKDIGLSCPRDFFASAEFLWMKPTEEGLDYVMQTDASSTASLTFPLTNGKVEGFSSGSREWDWRPGFRVGFGFYTNHDCWGFDASWTYIKIKADSEASSGGTGNLLSFWLPPSHLGEAVPIARSSVRWSGDFNTLDISIGKPYHVSRYFVSNPKFGIRAGFIDQDYHARNFINDVKRNITHKNDYWGVGLRGYYEGQFLLGSGWYIYGKAAFSLLYGKFDLSQKSDSTVPGSAYPTEVNYDVEDSFYSVQPNAELGMGINFSKFFCKNQYKAGLKIGYEFHHWWNQNQLRKFFDRNPVASDIVSRGDLSFNGLTFGLNLDF